MTWNESVKAGKLQDWDREPQVSYDVALYPDYNHPWWLPVARGRKEEVSGRGSHEWRGGVEGLK